jgi:hypothetical protein
MVSKPKDCNPTPSHERYSVPVFFFFFFGNSGCPGQFTHTTTNPQIYWTPCKPSRQIRHYGDDRRARWGSNPGDRGKETLSLPLGHKPRCILFLFFFSFFLFMWVSGQLARTTTNLTAHWTPCKPSRHVKHREDDRHAHEDSNPETAKEISPSHRQPKTLSAFCSCSCFYTYWPSKWHVKTPSRLMEFDIVCRSLAYY